jgi:hypothetical protein
MSFKYVTIFMLLFVFRYQVRLLHIYGLSIKKDGLWGHKPRRRGYTQLT